MMSIISIIRVWFGLVTTVAFDFEELSVVAVLGLALVIDNEYDTKGYNLITIKRCDDC